MKIKSKKARKRIKIAAIVLLSVTVLVVIMLAVCNMLVVNNAKGKVFESVDSIRPAEVGLLLGTTPQTRIGRRVNYFFKYRIDATEALYKAGKIKYVFISGDDKSLDGVDEPQCMKDSLVARGIPEDVIYMDGKGLRTLDSVVRLNKVFGVRTFTIISQRFHNERSLYLAEHLGLDVEDLQAFNAKDSDSTISLFVYVREYFARVKMFLDIFFDKQPSTMEEYDEQALPFVARP